MKSCDKPCGHLPASEKTRGPNINEVPDRQYL